MSEFRFKIAIYLSISTFSKQAVKADREGGQGLWTPPEKSQNYRVF